VTSPPVQPNRSPQSTNAPLGAPTSASPGQLEVVELLWAHEQIRQLAAHYAVAVDSRDLDALVELFVEDVNVGRDRRGRKALEEFFDSSLRAIGVSMLNVGTHAIDVLDPDHAIGSVYCLGRIQDGDRWIEQAILYRDTYERRSGRWLFVRRVHELWYGVETTRNPLHQQPADWPEHHDGRGTVPDSWPSWVAFWSPTDGLL
jgi:ketosteroid isomerase-like protein